MWNGLGADELTLYNISRRARSGLTGTDRRTERQR